MKKTEAIYPPRDGQRRSSEPGRIAPARSVVVHMLRNQAVLPRYRQKIGQAANRY